MSGNESNYIGWNGTIVFKGVLFGIKFQYIFLGDCGPI